MFTGILLIIVSVFVFFIFGIYGVLFCLALFTIVFLFSTVMTARDLRIGMGSAIAFKEVLISRLYRIYILSGTVLVFVCVLSEGIPSYYSAVVWILCGLVYLGRFLYTSRRLSRLPFVGQERSALIERVEQISLINGIALKVDEQSHAANMALLFGKRPVLVITGPVRDSLTDEQIIASMLHELGHFVHRDKKRRHLIYGADLIAISLLAFVFFFLDVLSAFFLLLVLCLTIALLLQPRPLINASVESEYRADAYFVACGFGNELLSALKTLDSINGMPSIYPKGILFSHPDFASRKAKIEKDMR